MAKIFSTIHIVFRSVLIYKRNYFTKLKKKYAVREKLVSNKTNVSVLKIILLQKILLKLNYSESANLQNIQHDLLSLFI